MCASALRTKKGSCTGARGHCGGGWGGGVRRVSGGSVLSSSAKDGSTRGTGGGVGVGWCEGGGDGSRGGCGAEGMRDAGGAGTAGATTKWSGRASRANDARHRSGVGGTGGRAAPRVVPRDGCGGCSVNAVGGAQRLRQDAGESQSTSPA